MVFAFVRQQDPPTLMAYRTPPQLAPYPERSRAPRRNAPKAREQRMLDAKHVKVEGWRIRVDHGAYAMTKILGRMKTISAFPLDILTFPDRRSD